VNKTKFFAGSLLISGAIGFFTSWALMPDPGTTDAVHILNIVKQSRPDVISSVVIQIITCVFYVAALFLLTRVIQLKNVSLVGICLVGVGLLGLCSDAFFHLLAWFMTDDSVDAERNVVRVMEFMQTDGVRFLIPLLLPFLIGSLILTIGLTKQKLISKVPALITSVAIVVGILMAIANKTHIYKGSVPVLDVLGLFAIGQALIGFEFLLPSRKIILDHTALDVYR
jgi:hypothetical protein